MSVPSNTKDTVAPTDQSKFHDQEAESGVIAAMLLRPSEIPAIRQAIGMEHFYRSELRTIFEAAGDAYEEFGNSLDVVLIGDRLKAQNKLAEVGGVPYLAEVMESCVAPSSWPYYADIVRTYAQIRSTYRDTMDLQLIFGNGHTPKEILSIFAERVADLTSKTLLIGGAVVGSQIQSEKIAWLWRNYFPCGMVSVLAGESGMGKSTMTTTLGAIKSRGRAWPDGAPGTEPGAVLYVVGEDPAGIVRDRFEYAGGDLDKMAVLECPRLDLTKSAGLIQNEAVRLNSRWIFIDPITHFLGKSDQNNVSEPRLAMDNLQRVASKTSAAITLVSHYNKNVLVGAKNRVVGSGAFVAFPRAVFGIAKDPDDHTSMILFPIKCNYSGLLKSLRFSMEMPEGESEPKRLHFDPMGIEDFDPDAGMQSPKTDGARDFLLEELSGGKVVDGVDLKDKAKNQGINEKTLWHAAKKIGVKMESTGFRESRQVFWSIQSDKVSIP